MAGPDGPTASIATRQPDSTGFLRLDARMIQFIAQKINCVPGRTAILDVNDQCPLREKGCRPYALTL